VSCFFGDGQKAVYLESRQKKAPVTDVEASRGAFRNIYNA